MDQLPPVADGLVVDEDARLRQEGTEAAADPELLGGFTGIVRAARTPEIELGAFLEELLDVFDHIGHGNALVPDAPHQRVVDVNVDHRILARHAREPTLVVSWTWPENWRCSRARASNP